MSTPPGYSTCYAKVKLSSFYKTADRHHMSCYGGNLMYRNPSHSTNLDEIILHNMNLKIDLASSKSC
ncbi:12468_t:CDS:2 [Funneliformis geosporum]|uniref:12468_t:CDS:1 n=1 Tax=Funneliformis geosporum TaxID=1117311 RepID=A0A9W4WHT4_9GLOM|nr:12468_t:CDS:2 [Funneliformis geosporum]